MAKRNPAVNPTKILGKSALKANKGEANSAKGATFGGAIKPQKGAAC